jgi:serine/threonine protein kinase
MSTGLAGHPARVGPFELGQEISQGSFFKVRLATDTRDGTIYVLKSFPTDRGKFADPDFLDTRECKHLFQVIKDVEFRQVAQLSDVLRTKHHVHLVYPFASGGPLMNVTRSHPDTEEQPRGYFCEDEARFYFQQLVAALLAVERVSARVAASSAPLPGLSQAQTPGVGFHLFHGDLRLDDLLLDRPPPAEYVPVRSMTRERKPELRVNGVGMMPLRLHAGVPTRAAKGQQHFTAPELLQVQPPITLDMFPLADAWSCGVVLYAMVTGTLPFDDPDPAVLTEKICAGQFSFPRHLSPGIRGVKHLIASMLVCDPARRMPLERVAAHPWFDIRLDPRLLTDDKRNMCKRSYALLASNRVAEEAQARAKAKEAEKDRKAHASPSP